MPHFRNKAKTLKEAQAGEHKGDDALKFYTEREWPKCDVIVSNPPFLGGKMIRRELSDAYVDALFQTFGERVRPEADLCCYWFEKARDQIATGKCRRAGLLATQGIRGGANRDVLKSIKTNGDIFFAESDRDWILAGANVHVSMVGFDDGSETNRILDGHSVSAIHSNLSAASADTTIAKRLYANTSIGFMGDTKVGPFEFAESVAESLLNSSNLHGRPTSDAVRPWVNGMDVTRRSQNLWTVDFPPGTSEADAALYEPAFEYIRKHVRPIRATARSGDRTGVPWWIHQRPRPDMRDAIKPLPRFLATPTVSKHRMFVWLSAPTLPDHQLIVFASDADLFFGVLHSRMHEIWALKLGTRLETRPRYTPTSSFETFPFPRPTPAQEDAIAAAAKELNELRERWLNPPEWTRTEFLEFPASADGPWALYVDCGGKRSATPLSPASGAQSAVAANALSAHSKIGLARYPRLVPRDADCSAKLKKRTLTNLYNERPAWLDLAHKKLDAAVAAAYGWPADLSDEQILEKLLALNLERAAEEAKAATFKKPRGSRAKREDEML